MASAAESAKESTVKRAGRRPFTFIMANAPQRTTDTSGARSIHLSHAKSAPAVAWTKWRAPTSA